MKDLLREGVVDRPSRHRAEPRTTDRVKLAASAAVAAGAIVGTAAQFAQAAPLLPVGHDNGPDTAELAKASAPVQQAEQQAAEPEPAEAAAPEPATAVAAPVAAPAPPAPFGLQNLPPEVAGPLSQAEQVIKGLQNQMAAPPAAVRPVAGAVSSNYGYRWGAMHSGIDFADSLGSPIRSVENGTVIEAGPASGFGQWVRVKNDDGTTAVYGHVNDILTQVGQRVNAGDVIATVGNRGNSTGPHLHLEIWDPGDAKMDPAPYLASKGVILSQQSWGPQ
ncbi:M23 family metallopeptidase [Nocardia sp. BMG51109]|uniref:M23 family metallopeptidase n=1 Tax=Nocardia sp. BMG51109 TaxID=1056816 RepID=UPI0004B7E882|nr:M23 family metallopeptidase [Nocardia sp. BMG51109]